MKDSTNKTYSDEELEEEVSDEEADETEKKADEEDLEILEAQIAALEKEIKNNKKQVKKERKELDNERNDIRLAKTNKDQSKYYDDSDSDDEEEEIELVEVTSEFDLKLQFKVVSDVDGYKSSLVDEKTHIIRAPTDKKVYQLKDLIWDDFNGKKKILAKLELSNNLNIHLSQPLICYYSFGRLKVAADNEYIINLGSEPLIVIFVYKHMLFPDIKIKNSRSSNRSTLPDHKKQSLEEVYENAGSSSTKPFSNVVSQITPLPEDPPTQQDAIVALSATQTSLTISQTESNPSIANQNSNPTIKNQKLLQFKLLNSLTFYGSAVLIGGGSALATYELYYHYTKQTSASLPLNKKFLCLAITTLTIALTGAVFDYCRTSTIIKGNSL